jgi:hypothetical protein
MGIKQQYLTAPIRNIKRVNELAMLAFEFAALDGAWCTLESYFLRLLLGDLGLTRKLCLLLSRFFFTLLRPLYLRQDYSKINFRRRSPWGA